MSAYDGELSVWREASDVPEAAVAQLRTAVLGHVRQPRSRVPGWKWLVPVGVAAGCLMWIASPRPEAQRGAPETTPPAIPAPVIVDVPEQPAARPLVTQRMRRPKAVVNEAAWIRLETDDPDVVILLVSDGGGE